MATAASHRRRRRGRSRRDASDPGDALLVYVAPDELGLVRLRSEVPQGPAGAAPEVQNPLALPVPVRGQMRKDRLSRRTADGVVAILKSATVGADVAHPPSKAIRRKGLAAHAARIWKGRAAEAEAAER